MFKKVLLVGCMIVLLMAGNLAGAAPAQAQADTRILFQPGATSGAVSGQLAARGSQVYVLGASAGQRMEVTLMPSAGATLSIWGADGQFLKWRGDGLLSWQGTLPRTQDYYVQVVAGSRPISYGLRTTIYARIQFVQGATSATLSSPAVRLSMEDAALVGGYVLRASAGQTMRVSVKSANHNILLAVLGADGTPLKRYEVGEPHWEGTLPATQDYFLKLYAVGPDSRFTMRVWISPLGQAAPTRIRFAPGATSATVSGHLAPGSPARYVLWAARGQRMEIAVWPALAPDVPPPVIDLTVSGLGGHTWSGPWFYGTIDPLPASGDYVITLALRPGPADTNYMMEVTIPPL